MNADLTERIAARYGSISRWDHFHARQRLRLCPYERLLPYLPATGNVLDVGCGTGLFGQFLGETRPGLHYFGADVDTRKVAVAEKVFERTPTATAHLYGGDVRAWSERPQHVEAVVILDVLYLMPLALQKSLFDFSCSALAPNSHAVLLVKIIPPLHGLARLRTWLQESMMVHVLRKTQSSGALFSSQHPTLYADWGKARGFECQVVDLRTEPSSLLLVFSRGQRSGG